jgi:adenosine 3'-phospho 5'-phosphosulfate transporter B3
MLIASVVHKKLFTVTEYLCALAACTGLVMFAAADWNVSPTFHPIGLALVSLSVCADAVLPNAQEGVFKLGSSRLEVTLYTNIFTLLIMTVYTFLSGDLMGSLHQIMNSRQLTIYFSIYTFIAYVAISFHMNVVKRFGGVAAVLVATGRKAMTLIFSFLIFPKRFSWFYLMGSILILGGLLISSLSNIRSKDRNKRHPRERSGHHHHANGNGNDNKHGEEEQLPLTANPKLLKAHQSDMISPNSHDHQSNDFSPRKQAY